MKSIKERLNALRGVRHLELLVVLFVLAVAALVLLSGQTSPISEPTATALEARMEAVLSKVEGAGRVRVLLQEKESAVSAFSQAQPGQMERVEGVVVVSEGADNVRVALELARAVKALLGVEMDRIEVLRMERSGRG